MNPLLVLPRGIFLISTAFVCVVSPWCVAAGAEPTNLVSNGDFEADAKSQGWPDGWGRPKDKSVAWVQESGNHFLRMHCEQPGQTAMAFRDITIPADVRALELKWRWRITDLKPGQQAWFDARIMMDFKDAAGKKLSPGPAAPYARKNTDGWVERSVTLLVPEGTHALQFMPALFQVEAGTFDLDDVVLMAIDPAPLKQAGAEAARAAAEKAASLAGTKRAKAAAGAQPDGSLLANGNFEADAKGQGWPDGWGRAKDKSIAWEQEDGNHFLRLQSLEPGKQVMVYRPIDLPAGVKALTLSWRQRISGLKKGKLPWNDARIMMDFQDATGKKLSQKPSPPYTTSDTKGWQEKTTSFLVPEEAVTLVLMPSLFEVAAGTFDLDDITLKPSDPEPLYAAAKTAAEVAKARYVPPEEPKKDKWPQPLHVAGNRLVNPDGKEVWLQGLNAGGLESVAQGDQVIKSTVVGIDEWKANVIRLPVRREFWTGDTPLMKDGGKAYRECVDQIVTLAANRGAYVALDLHRFRAPDQKDADFWKDAAARYKNHPAVLFDIFNEPHGISWEVWRDGGYVAEKSKPGDEDSFLSEEEKIKLNKGFHSIGMQALVDAVRGTGARNIIIAGGLDWAYDLSGIVKGFVLKDKDGQGIMLSTHIYNWKKGWESKVLPAAEKYPIFVGEVGADVKKMDFMPAAIQEDPATWVPDMLGLLQKYRLNWTGWCFHPAATPIMISDWKYTPTPFWGLPAKEALAGKQFALKHMR